MDSTIKKLMFNKNEGVKIKSLVSVFAVAGGFGVLGARKNQM